MPGAAEKQQDHQGPPQAISCWSGLSLSATSLPRFVAQLEEARGPRCMAGVAHQE